MTSVRPKKHLGQHFLTNDSIAQRIVAALPEQHDCEIVLEVGPGTGVLTSHLLKKNEEALRLVEIDRESIAYLKAKYPNLSDSIIEKDFLKLDFSILNAQRIALIGNFPYNISSQILFRVFENQQHIPFVVGMFQEEVARRIAAPPGSKTYGILSVLLQSFYQIEYLFTVAARDFNPPPKVKSGVLRLTHRGKKRLPCHAEDLKLIVKSAFQHRRKKLRNALQKLIQPEFLNDPVFDQRPESLSPEEFISLTAQLMKPG